MKRVAVLLLLVAGCSSRQSRETDFAAQYRSARELLTRGDFERAGELARRTAGQARRAGAAGWTSAFLVLDGELLALEGQRDEAIRRLNAIEPPASRPDVRARRNAALAMELCRDGTPEQFRRADALLEEGARAVHDAGPELRGEVEMRSASCLIDRDRLPEAGEALRGVLDLARTNGLRFLEGSALVTLTYLSWRGSRYEECATYSKDSLAIAREIGSDRLLLNSLGNLGLCYSDLGNYDLALEYLRQAESLAPQREFREDYRKVLQNVGNLLYFFADYPAAASYYGRALDLAQDKRAKAQLNANLGFVALERGDFETAQRFNTEALRLKRELGDPIPLRRSEVLAARILLGKGELQASAAEFRRLRALDGPEDVIWESHAGLAGIYSNLGRKREAESEYRAAISVVENSRDALTLDESRITFQSALSNLYDSYIAFLAESGRPREALAAADRSRAATLAQRTGQPRLHSSNDRPFEPQLLAKATQAVLLNYWMTPQATFLWVVTPSRIEQYQLPGQAEIERRVADYQHIVERPRDVLRDAEQPGIALWRLLIGPAANLIPANARVLIVPDRGLHRLNFETLIAPSPIPHFWIDDVTIAEVPALRALEPVPHGAPRDSILLIGNPAAADREYPALRYAAAEISGIEQLYPASDRRVLTGTEATPRAYLNSDPRRFRYIHFAAHATANRIRPLDSAVIFARSAGEYKLFARDVLNAPLNAELVIISGCRSAGAHAYAGEGLVGFAWAFFRAGARNVIAGLWNVEDASTAQLMVQLHRELRLGRPPAVALRNSKLALLHSGTSYRRPFYWAPFLLYTRTG